MANRFSKDIGFDEDIKPLFRDSDRDCMVARGLDLHDWWEVRKRSASILKMISAGAMPPDRLWEQAQIQLLSDWISEAMPKRKPSIGVEFFADIDRNTEYAPEGTGVMTEAIVVMSRVLPFWKDYIELINDDDSEEALEDLLDAIKIPENQSAILAIDNMLCNVFDKHFVDPENGFIDEYAVLDAFESFGRDLFPADSQRVANFPNNFDPEFHRMDTTSMWFNWAGQLDCANLLGQTPEKQDRRSSMMSGLILGCPMDYVFREDSKGADSSNPRAPTDPTYVRNEATLNRIRNKAKRSIQRWDRSLERIKELYRFSKGLQPQSIMFAKSRNTNSQV